MFEDLRGKVAVVTGGGRGLGYSLAQALADNDVAVGLLDVLPGVKKTPGRWARSGVCRRSVWSPMSVTRRPWRQRSRP